MKGLRSNSKSLQKPRPGDPSVPRRSNCFPKDTSLGNMWLSHLLSVGVKPTGSTQHFSYQRHTLLFMLCCMNWHEPGCPLPISFCWIHVRKTECAVSQLVFHGNIHDECGSTLQLYTWAGEKCHRSLLAWIFNVHEMTQMCWRHKAPSVLNAAAVGIK